MSSSFSQPVLSIVIPHLGDERSFEASLISVLENRPERCEVLVAHDGRYSDPFDLGDVVRFVVAERGDVVSLVLAAAEQTRSALLHVLAHTARATEGWTASAIDAFADPATAAVTPLAMQWTRPDRIATLGWTDRIGGLCRGVAIDRQRPTRRDLAAAVGPLLQASFWRTRVLRQLAALPTDGDPVVAQYGWSKALAAVGHRLAVAPDSRVLVGSHPVGLAPLSARTACRLQSIRSVIHQAGSGAAVAAGLLSVVAGPHRPAAWREAAGRIGQPIWGGCFTQRYAAGLSTLGESLASSDPLDEPRTLPMARQSPRAHAFPRSYGRAA